MVYLVLFDDLYESKPHICILVGPLLFLDEPLMDLVQGEDYPCFVILKSLDRTDIRLYEFKVNAIPQKIKAQLEFKVPARGQVT